MLAANEAVFLLDVDNTLLDNDRFGADLEARLQQTFGAAGRDRYLTIYSALRDELGYADYLGALQQFRFGLEDCPELLQISAFMLEYPFADRLYPRALDTIAHLRTLGMAAVLSDGDIVFQPRKIQRSGIWDAVEGRVIPGTPKGVPAIEESIFAGVPINVTLLFSREQYLASAEAYLRGIERRIAAGLDPRVGSVASVFVSRWDKAVSDKVPAELRNRLGIAVAAQTYRASRELLASPRWRGLADAGAQPQRLLWGSTGTKDPQASDTLYVEALAAPDTINTIPEKTLRAFAEHGELNGVMAEDGGDSEAVLKRFAQAGIDVDALAEQLQREGAQAFVKSWKALLLRIAEKSEALADAGVRNA